MNETREQPGSWQHASWVSPLGKWAWIIIIVIAIISLIVNILLIPPAVAAWEALREYYEFLGQPMPLIPIGGFIWEIIADIIAILISFAIIRPKFSNKCASQDWDALYDWTLTLGNFKIPWMLIWGIILEVFGWWAGLSVLIPALMLIFLGPKPYNWTK